MSRRVRAGLAVAGLLCALALSACGSRSNGGGSGSARVPADLDSMAFHPESAQVRADIDSGNAQYIQAWKLGSADLFAKIFAIDGELTRRDGTRLHGRDTITAYMGNVFAQWQHAPCHDHHAGAAGGRRSGVRVGDLSVRDGTREGRGGPRRLRAVRAGLEVQRGAVEDVAERFEAERLEAGG